MKAAKFIQFTLLRLLHIQLDSNLPLFLPTFCTKLHCLFLSTMFSFSFSSELLPQVFLIRFFFRLSCDVKKSHRKNEIGVQVRENYRRRLVCGLDTDVALFRCSMLFEPAGDIELTTIQCDCPQHFAFLPFSANLFLICRFHETIAMLLSERHEWQSDWIG